MSTGTLSALSSPCWNEREEECLVRAFVFWFAIALVLFWIGLSIEHGRAVGKGIKKTMKQFFKGSKRKEREENE